MKPIRSMVLLFLGLCGCAHVSPLARPEAGGATLTLTPRYQSGGYRAQAVVPQVDVTSVNHLVLALNRVTPGGETPVLSTGGVPVTADLSRAELSNPITFEHLTRNTTYRIRAYAYRGAGTDPSDLISVTAESYVDVAVGDDDRPALSPLTVKLTATPFAASARVSLSATGSVLFTSLDLGFYSLAGNTETLVATRSLRAEDVPSTVSFGNLQAMTTYRLKAQAKDLNGQAIAGADAQLDVAVVNDTDVTTKSLQVSVP
ncbi:hypothetical protein J7643_18200 [bacterium]|nr:hypothetical protein [bacterium]